MLGRSMFREMDEDPFFQGHSEQMRHMDEMFRRPFGGMGMLDHGQGQERERRGDRSSSNEVTPFGGGFGFGNMFEGMQNMMRDTERAFAHAASDSNGQTFQQSSFMSYSKSGEGPPKVYQASKSTRSGPGGVRETRKSLRDSERELEKMGIGHHIHDRGHEVERHKNTRSGTIDELNNFHNIEESEAEAFDREWKEKTKQAFKGLDYDDRRPKGRRGDRDRRALPDSRERALPEAPSEHWGRSTRGRSRDRQ